MTSSFPDDLISAYLDGELNADERARVEEQLRRDPKLQRMCDELRALRATLQAMPASRPPEDFSERVLRQAERRMLLGEHDEESGREAAPPAASEEAEPTAVERRARKKRNWRLVLPLIATVATTVLVAAFLYRPSLFQAPRDVARTENLQTTDGAEAAATPDVGPPGQETTGGSAESLSLGETSERPDASVEEALQPESSSARAPGRPRESKRTRRKKRAAGTEKPTAGQPAAPPDGRASRTHAFSHEQRGGPDAYGGTHPRSSNSLQAGEEDAEPSSPPGSGLAREDAAPSSRASRDAGGYQKTRAEGGRAKRLESEKPAPPESPAHPANNRRSGQPKGPVPEESHYGLGMGGAGGMGGAIKQRSPDTSASSEPGKPALELEPPAGFGKKTNANVSGKHVDTPAKWQFVDQLDAGQSLWVQVSVSADSKMKLLESLGADRKENQPEQAVARRFLGTVERGAADLNISAIKGKKSSAVNLSDDGGAGDQIILVEGSKETLCRSLEQLVNRADVRIERVSKTVAADLREARQPAETDVEKPSGRQETKEDAAAQAADMDTPHGSVKKKAQRKSMAVGEEAGQENVVKSPADSPRAKPGDGNMPSRLDPAEASAASEPGPAVKEEKSSVAAKAETGQSLAGKARPVEKDSSAEPSSDRRSREQVKSKENGPARAAAGSGAESVKKGAEAESSRKGGSMSSLAEKEQALSRRRETEAVHGDGDKTSESDSATADEIGDKAEKPSSDGQRESSREGAKAKTVLHFVFRCLSESTSPAAQKTSPESSADPAPRSGP